MYYGTNGRYYFRYCGNYIDLGMLSIIPMAIPMGLILIDALLYGIDTFTTKENEELT